MAYKSPSRGKITSNFQSSLAEALSNVTDPTTIEKRQVVYQREPEIDVDDFDGYPYVYLEDYSVQMEAATINGHRFSVPATAEIVIEARDEDAKSKAHHDDLSDQVTNIFMVDQRYNMANAGWSKVELTRNSRTSTSRQNGKPIIRRSMEFSFNVVVDLNESS